MSHAQSLLCLQWRLQHIPRGLLLRPPYCFLHMEMTIATIHDPERRLADRLNRTLLQRTPMHRQAKFRHQTKWVQKVRTYFNPIEKRIQTKIVTKRKTNWIQLPRCKHKLAPQEFGKRWRDISKQPLINIRPGFMMESQSFDAIKDKLTDLFEVEKPSVDGVRIIIRGRLTWRMLICCRRQSAEGRYISCSESFMVVEQSRKIGHNRGDKSCAWTIEALRIEQRWGRAQQQSLEHGFESDLQ